MSSPASNKNNSASPAPAEEIGGSPGFKRPPLHMAYANDHERDYFNHNLRSFVPPDSFDAHAHLYIIDSPRKIAPPPAPGSCQGSSPENSGGNSQGIATSSGASPWASPAPAAITFADYDAYTRSWMGDRAPCAGLFFGYPVRGLDPTPDNDLIAAQLVSRNAAGLASHATAGASARAISRGLLVVRPDDDPDAVAARIDREGWQGMKIYHLYASRPDTFNAAMHEFLPEWIWQLADRKNLAIMYHMVRDHALADPANQREIRHACLRYPSARLILAHAARGFCADHTVQGIHSVADLDNVFFDTSAIAEPAALMAILHATGTRRLMFATDFPVSQLRGRNVSLGQGFWWLYHNNIDNQGWPLGNPVLNGIDQLIALKHAAKFSALNDTDVENIFCHNARQILDITPPNPSSSITQNRYDTARAIIPGGTQLLSKRPEMFAPQKWPAYYAQARGIETFDLDGRRYLDFSITGIGSTLLGFADPHVNAAVIRRVNQGSMATLNPPEEVELAQLLIALHPWAQMARFTRTGGEAMAAAVRIARAATNRSHIAICGYHGWHDWYIAANLNKTNPSKTNPNKTNPHHNNTDSLSQHLLPGLHPAGVPHELAGTTHAFTYNQPQQLQAILDNHAHELAAIVMEPTRADDPKDGFLDFVRNAATKHNIPLIFDEITIGWRLARGGAHLHYQTHPDIAVFSKATGNGHPIAAIIGTKPIMDAAQHSFISSTMWTEAVGPAAAIATIHKLIQHDTPAHLHQVGSLYQQGMRDIAAALDLPLIVHGRPCISHIKFDLPQTDHTARHHTTPQTPAQHQPAQHHVACDNAALITLYTHLMLDRGYLASAGFYPTLAHQPRHVQTFLHHAHDALAIVKKALDENTVLQRINHLPRHTGFARLT